MHRISIILPVFWIAISSSFHIDDLAKIRIIANVTVLLAHEHATRCVQIFHTEQPNGEEIQTLYKLWKELATPKSHLTTGLYSFQRYVQRKKGNPWKVSCYRTTKILFASNRTKPGYEYLMQEWKTKDSIWILFGDSDMFNFLSKVDLLFDSIVIVAKILPPDLVLLYEVYRVRKDFPVRVHNYGKWTPEKGLEVPTSSVFRSRSDLEGLQLATGSIENWPNTYFRRGKWKGFFIEVWSVMEKLTNSTSINFKSVDGETGLKTSNGSWNGLIGMALKGDIDLVLSEITLEKTRTHVMDLFHPLIYTSYQLYYRQRGYNLQWGSIFKPFDKTIWLAIVLWIILGTLTVSSCYYLSLLHGFETRETALSPTSSFFFMLQSLSQQGHSNVPISAACRILFFVSYMLSAVLIPSYSASLISYLTLQVPYRPFNSLEEMHQLRTYRLLIKDNTAEFGYFKAGKSQLLKDIFKQQILTVPKEHGVINTEQAFQLLCRYPQYVFFGIDIIMRIRLGKFLIPKCPIISTTNPISSVYLTMGTKKYGPYSGLFNYHLMRMILTGVVKRIQAREMPQNFKEPATALQREVALVEVFQMFVFVGVSIVMSMMILILENKHYKCIAKIKKSRTKKFNFDINMVLWAKKSNNLPKKKPFLPPLWMQNSDQYVM